MPRVPIHRHPDCERCARVARFHDRFDWLGRLDASTDTPPGGPLRMGEIEVVDHRTGESLRGVAAVRRVFRQIPAYLPLLPLLYLPPVVRKIERELSGCDGDTCGVPGAAAPSAVGAPSKLA